MIRKSFLRNTKLEQLTSNKWELPSIGTKNIGFGICPKSGLVMQSPSPTPNQIQTYYETAATYINPGRDGKPSLEKVKVLDRMINYTISSIGLIPKSIFQVGCSNGYTLNRFREAGATFTTGIDPSIASHDLAKRLYNIETIIGPFEDYNDKSNKYDLFILTHVLEHLFNPIDTLRKCNDMQNDDGWILIEVPLFERMDLFGPGIFTLEHLNYFSEKTLIETVTRSGYEVIFSTKYFFHHEYPVITIIARKDPNVNIIKSNDYNRSSVLAINYINQEKKSWEKIEQKIKERVDLSSSIYIYGAGIHTSQLLAYTDIKETFNIIGLLDSSSTKWGKNIGKYNCYNINEININENDIFLISSYASENEIFKFLVKNYNNKIVRLYGDKT